MVGHEGCATRPAVANIRDMRLTTGSARRRAFALSTLVALALVGTAAPPGVAQAATPNCTVDDFDARRIDGDLDGDRSADVVVGVPNLIDRGAAAAGGVDAHLSGGARQRVTLDTLGEAGDSPNGAGFGAAVATAEFDGDVCDDLAVGAPGLDGTGAVFLVHGSRLGLTAGGVVRVEAPDGAAGDGFGAAVATTLREDGGTDLWVGAPGRTVSGEAAAGAVYRFRVGADSAVSLVDTLSYATAGVDGAPAAGDRFGEVLAPMFQGVAVGVPRRTVQDRARAGEVVFVTVTGTALATTVVNQGSPSVPGAAEAGDRFGAAVARGAVGVPGEDLGSVTDAGSVQTFRSTADGPVAGRSYTQDSAGVPGKAERGDRFGAALAGGTWLLCQEQSDVAVGAPGESVGTATAAGSVTLISLPTEGAACTAPRVLTQRSGLPGGLAAGNRVGAELGTLSGDREQEEDFRSHLVVGVPGQDGAARDAGAVLVVRAESVPTYRSVGGQVRDQAYGSVLVPLA